MRFVKVLAFSVIALPYLIQAGLWQLSLFGLAMGCLVVYWQPLIDSIGGLFSGSFYRRR